LIFRILFSFKVKSLQRSSFFPFKILKINIVGFLYNIFLGTINKNFYKRYKYLNIYLKNMSKIKIITLIIVICFELIESQRGGGSSGGSRSSSSHSYSSHHYYGGSTVSTPWSWSDTLILGGIFLAIIPIGICAVLSEQKK
jgi:hypothetical protein